LRHVGDPKPTIGASIPLRTVPAHRKKGAVAFGFPARCRRSIGRGDIVHRRIRRSSVSGFAAYAKDKADNARPGGELRIDFGVVPGWHARRNLAA